MSVRVSSVRVSCPSLAGALALALALAFGAGAHAEGAKATANSASSASTGSLHVENGWMRATAPGQSVGGGFLTVNNQGADDRLVGASSPASASVELHTMSMDNNVMRMREVNDIEVPSGKKLELQPGGLHLMFIDLKAPLKAGETVPLNLRFEKAGEVSVSLRVEAMGAMKAGHAGH